MVVGSLRDIRFHVVFQVACVYVASSVSSHHGLLEDLLVLCAGRAAWEWSLEILMPFIVRQRRLVADRVIMVLI